MTHALYEPRTKEVRLVCDAPDARVVGVAGSFNAWDVARTPHKEGPDGLWRITVVLNPGTYEYQFIADGNARSPLRPSGRRRLRVR